MQSPLHVLRLYVKYVLLMEDYAHNRKPWIFLIQTCKDPVSFKSIHFENDKKTV
ncbi:hypothetical protein P615_06870 [Brevibacillus laterosporus PE36]|nr:hypothetical protein P615_06870 [Brevibacillus laterosporus PE36]